MLSGRLAIIFVVLIVVRSLAAARSDDSGKGRTMDRRPGKDEYVIQAIGMPDRQGRTMFFAHWLDDKPFDDGGPIAEYELRSSTPTSMTS